MATFWTNSINFPNLTTKVLPTASDYVLIADEASSPPGQPKKALISSLPSGLSGAFDITTATYTALPNSENYVDYVGGTCTVTLPNPGVTPCPLGTYVKIRGGEANTAPFVVGINAGQTIRDNTNALAITLTSYGNFDDLELECNDATGAGLKWIVVNSNGNFQGST
jgi:hypothetical protein